MTTQPQAPNLGAIKERQQKAWSSGDYGKVGVTLVIMAERLCEAADLRSGQQVLDVATGNGNAALAAARRFCEVIGLTTSRCCWMRDENGPKSRGCKLTFGKA